ncbi:hypothetical protein PMIN01_13263 [Paraphaeosphaeria minitans]|uniref:Zn(2)-C6 fungal-type domain-containing protein n=1 Tax=Paraphaeosphaeria minitans TaxID=565426 RepID=A0A9P6G545_9PLEO|nr:hypothetical protein PMIN01_13263 [Paraphaeosphaeria minitans]
MTVEDAKKRKACQSCTKSKAKCSPSEDRLGICYRCQRLKKECFLKETAKKRGPKNRSRVKQLEQRVDTLIDLLANGQAASIPVSSSASATQGVHLPLAIPPESPDDPDGRSENVPSPYGTPARSPENIPYVPAEACCKAYDPVADGLLDDYKADSLLQEFRHSYTPAFPFVIVPPSINGKALRQSHPFLFHAILTVTTHRQAGLQATLAAKLKEQISLRVISHSHKSLELLQGILLYTGWYHFYYDPFKQHLAVMLQLCIAMLQDLGFSKNPQNAKKKIPMGDIGASLYSVRSLAEKRAFLGTFYMAAKLSLDTNDNLISHNRGEDQRLAYLAAVLEHHNDAAVFDKREAFVRLWKSTNYDFFTFKSAQKKTLKVNMKRFTKEWQVELERIQKAKDLGNNADEVQKAYNAKVAKFVGILIPGLRSQRGLNYRAPTQTIEDLKLQGDMSARDIQPGVLLEALKTNESDHYKPKPQRTTKPKVNNEPLQTPTTAILGLAISRPNLQQKKAAQVVDVKEAIWFLQKSKPQKMLAKLMELFPEEVPVRQPITASGAPPSSLDLTILLQSSRRIASMLSSSHNNPQTIIGKRNASEQDGDLEGSEKKRHKGEQHVVARSLMLPVDDSLLQVETNWQISANTPVAPSNTSLFGSDELKPRSSLFKGGD